MSSYRVVTPSAYEPVSLDEMKAYLNMKPSDTSRDDLLTALLASAQDYIERYTKRHMGRVKVEQVWDEWPENGRMTLLAGLTSAMCELAYWDGEAWAIVPEADYYTDLIGRPARIRLKRSQPGPTDAVGGVKATYWAGMDDGSDIPPTLIAMLKILVAQWLENGSDQDTTDLGYVNGILKQYVLNK